MATPRAGDIPMDLKAVKPFLIIHKQLEKEHPVVSYFGEATPLCVCALPSCVCAPPCVVLMFAVQEGIKVGKSPEGKTYLFSSMDKLDTVM